MSEKRASQSGLVWLLPSSSSSSSSIPFWSPWDFSFHPTSQSLSPNLLCSTWKDSGYRSFSFLPPSNSKQINSPSHPYIKPLSAEAPWHLLQLPGGLHNRRPVLLPPGRRMDAGAVGQQSERRGQGVGVVYRRDNKQARPSGTQASTGANVA